MICCLIFFGVEAQSQKYYFKPDWPIGKKANFHITVDTLVENGFQKAFTSRLETEITQENSTHYTLKIRIRSYDVGVQDSVLVDDVSFTVGMGKLGLYNDFSWNTDMQMDSLGIEKIWTRPMSKVWIPDLIRQQNPLDWSHWDLWKTCVERILVPIQFIYEKNWNLGQVSTHPAPPFTLYPDGEEASGQGRLRTFDEKNHAAMVEWTIRHSKYSALHYEILFDYAYSMPMDVKIEIGSADEIARQIMRWKYLSRG